MFRGTKNHRAIKHSSSRTNANKSVNKEIKIKKSNDGQKTEAKSILKQLEKYNDAPDFTINDTSSNANMTTTNNLASPFYVGITNEERQDIFNIKTINSLNNRSNSNNPVNHTIPSLSNTAIGRYKDHYSYNSANEDSNDYQNDLDESRFPSLIRDPEIASSSILASSIPLYNPVSETPKINQSRCLNLLI